MLVEPGQIVSTRDGRTIYVTDVASQEPDDYRVYSIDAYTRDGSLEVKDELPVETIFVGKLLTDKFRYYYDNYDKLVVHVGADGVPYDKYIVGSVVSDMSEVVSILT